MTGPANINHVSVNYTKLHSYEYLHFEKQYLLSVNFRRLSIKFYISGVNFVQFVHIDYISYDRAKLKKVGDIYAPTWLIFTGLVTNFVNSWTSHTTLYMVYNIVKFYTNYQINSYLTYHTAWDTYTNQKGLLVMRKRYFLLDFSFWSSSNILVPLFMYLSTPHKIACHNSLHKLPAPPTHIRHYPLVQ